MVSFPSVSHEPPESRGCHSFCPKNMMLEQVIPLFVDRLWKLCEVGEEGGKYNCSWTPKPRKTSSVNTRLMVLNRVDMAYFKHLQTSVFLFLSSHVLSSWQLPRGQYSGSKSL